MAPTSGFVLSALTGRNLDGQPVATAPRRLRSAAARRPAAPARRSAARAPVCTAGVARTPQATAPITEAQVARAQQMWAAGVLRMGALKDDRSACAAFAEQFLDDVYAFAAGTVLFKPTRAAAVPFRATRAQALSYFVGGDARACAEDAGFALSPPWTDVRFENHALILEHGRALAMGHYFFKDADGAETKVEYTFGYTLVDGVLKVDVHHSSFPFNPAQ